MILKFKSSVFYIFMMASFSVYAGSGSGKIIGFIPYANGVHEIIIIKVENNSGMPTCNTTTRFAMKENNPKYQGTKSAALAAYLAGTSVVVRGENNCSAWGNAESILALCLGDIPC